MGDVNWRDKDDLDLTSEDIDSMIAEGQPVQVRGPVVPGKAFYYDVRRATKVTFDATKVTFERNAYSPPAEYELPHIPAAAS